jgi:uncharacterized protein YceH (UPF0502 family)
MMDLLLDPVEVRVLGALIEKDITTPEYYPMTMNALINACNQRSNRDPVVSYDEDTVAEAIDRLRDKRLVGVLTGGSNRVPKYSHRLQESLNLGRREVALLCELMIRGPQTIGELRDHASRMHRFSDLEEVESCLRSMSDQELTTQLARQPGRKEARYAHLLSGEVTVAETSVSEVQVRTAPSDLEARIIALETEVRGLHEQIEHIRRELGLS